MRVSVCASMSPELAEAIKARASREGCPFSEVIRVGMARHLGLENASSNENGPAGNGTVLKTREATAHVTG